MKRLIPCNWILPFVISFVFSRECYANPPLRFIDRAGTIHFVESIDQVPPEYRSQITRPTSTPSLTKAQQRAIARQRKVGGNSSATVTQSDGTAPFANAQQEKLSIDHTTVKKISSPILFFTSPTCKNCEKIEELLKQNRIKFRKMDIEKSEKAFKMYDALGGGELPMVKIGKRIVRGNHPSAIEDAFLRAAKEEGKK